MYDVSIAVCVCDSAAASATARGAVNGLCACVQATRRLTLF